MGSCASLWGEKVHTLYKTIYVPGLSHTHYSSLSLIRMPLNNHIILMHHVMIKNNGDFHFSSPLFPPPLFLHCCRKATCLLFYGFFSSNFIPSTWNLEDASWVMTMMVIPLAFCHWILNASYRTWYQMLVMGMGTRQRSRE